MREEKLHNPLIRNKNLYLIATIGVIVLGMASRYIHGLFPLVLGKYPGDALWALMMFLGLGYLMPGNSTIKNLVIAIVISFAVEISQLYQAPWINSIRNTTLGHLVLGSGFGWVDFLAYIAGILVGFTGEYGLRALLIYRSHAQKTS
jgi:hypothetical protein